MSDEPILRPFTTYKGFGGVLAAFSLPTVILALLDIPTLGDPPSLLPALFAGLLGAVGLYVFIASDRKIKLLEAGTKAKKHGPDWKGISIAGSLFVLYLAAVVVQVRA